MSSQFSTNLLYNGLYMMVNAREPIPYLPPPDKLSHEKKRLPFCGLAEYLSQFQEVKDEVPVVKTETREEKKERRRKERLERVAYKLEQDLALWDPHAVRGTADPYKTLFVARLSYETSESKLRREFEEFGPIRKVFLVKDSQAGKSRGYAFVEYEHERDMHAAYKHADGRKIDGRRVVVDYERGRTVKGWRPRRLGGGLGGEKRRTKTMSEDAEDGHVSSGRGERRSREREPERDRDRREKDYRSDRDRDRKRRSRTKSRSRSRSRSRDRKRVKDEKRSKDNKKERDRSTERDRKDKKDRDRSRTEDASDGRKKRRNSGSDQEAGEYANSKSRSGAPAAAFDGSDGESSANGKDKNYDGSSQGF